MQTVYNFESAVPPILSEKQLDEIIRQRTLGRQATLLRIASVLMCAALAMLAFVIAPKSMPLAYACLGMLFVSLVGNGIISALFYYKGTNIG